MTNGLQLLVKLLLFHSSFFVKKNKLKKENLCILPQNRDKTKNSDIIQDKQSTGLEG